MPCSFSDRLIEVVWLWQILIVANVIGLFAIPQLAGFRNPRIDVGLVRFLQQHLKLNRFYTLGAFSPNFGSYFQAASINYNGLPIPKTWVDYIHSSLDPGAHPILFLGFVPPPSSDRERELRTHLQNFEGVGVRYVLATPGTNPFLPSAATGTMSRDLLTSPGGSANTPRLAYKGKVADVWELPHPADYFDAGPGRCILSNPTRESVEANCAAETTLIRRELSYPGWQAVLNDRTPLTVRANSIFQEVHLPKGTSHVRFYYVPSNTGWAIAAASFAFLWMVSRFPAFPGGGRDLRSRPGTTPASIRGILLTCLVLLNQ